MASDADDHYFRGFHQGGGGLAFAELHLAGGVGRDDGCDPLIADFQDHLGEKAGYLYLNNFADELIAAADGSEALAGRRGGGGGL
jgi:hypothetical protein